uniref:Membrane protein n=1 Tax=Thermogemmatispora argillosa TaxID=2045280 RepID=A0A455T653_9CHLR|nr:membrane protein [Thermogemmatispora argillosa]
MSEIRPAPVVSPSSSHLPSSRSPQQWQPLLVKVPEITLYFWVIKLLTTALGESTSDFLVYQINPYLAVGLGCFGLVAALILQLWLRRYVAWVYWLAALMVAVFGTMAADVLHVVLGISYVVSTIFFATALALIFVVWYLCERTLSIHSVYRGRREWFYWAAVIATFALGTAVGDLTAATLNLGYFPSIVLFGVLFALPALGYWLLGFNAIAAFWWAYIVTRPLGASIADWLGKPYLGGLGLGDGKVSLVLLILLIGFVAYLSITQRDVQRRPAEPR